MNVNIIKPVIYHDRLGALRKGRVVDLPEKQAQEFLRKGWVERYETKVIRERPIPADGREALSSASQVAQASPSPTVSESEPGAKKRGRPRKEPLSSPTQPTE
jgi:hypothetical protein